MTKENSIKLALSVAIGGAAYLYAVTANAVDCDSGFAFDTETQALSVDLNAAPLMDVLECVSRATEVDIRLSPRVARAPLTAQIEDRPLDEALAKLLARHNLIMEFDPDGYLTKLVVMADGKDDPTDAIEIGRLARASSQSALAIALPESVDSAMRAHTPERNEQRAAEVLAAKHEIVDAFLDAVEKNLGKNETTSSLRRRLEQGEDVIGTFHKEKEDGSTIVPE